MEEKTLTSRSMQNFEAIIEGNIIYVDKTGYLAQMLEKGEGAWFLAHPRRFGKSLTVSALNSIFLGKNELFSGLVIEKRLHEPNFAPRPVIHLDMSAISPTSGLNRFESSLTYVISRIAESLGVEVSKNLKPSQAFSLLIKGCHKKNGRKVAVLIDEYDYPLTNLLDRPDDMDMDKVRKSLRRFYSQLKSNLRHISFVFVTGITKLAVGGLYAGCNNPIDISTDPQYGALTGFTHEEILRYYPYQIRQVAARQKMSENELLRKMKEYYYGFCFDGKTHLYNPHSMLRFFYHDYFGNFWFTSGSPQQLMTYWRKTHLNIEQFRNYSIPKEKIDSPNENAFHEPAVFLFRTGYLSLRPCHSNENYLLDYPNVEVRVALAKLILRSYHDSYESLEILLKTIKNAILERNPTFLIDGLNKLLAGIPREYYYGKKEYTNLKGSDGAFYCAQIFLVFYALNFNLQLEKHAALGRADFVVRAGNQTWAIGLKVSHNAANPNKTREFYEWADKAARKELAFMYFTEEMEANRRGYRDFSNNVTKRNDLPKKARLLATAILSGEMGLEALGPISRIMASILLERKAARLAKAGTENDLEKQGDAVEPTDQKLADLAFEEILNYEDQYDNPVILAFVINDRSRKITAYKDSVGSKKVGESG
ncbi:MAG: AAA family ATPase [Deltaproteobacteria bacterium]|nr:AAA family ATPase [Deltaproteobacteria bacterium]